MPECEDNGDYSPSQGWASTGYQWCVTPDGLKIPGTDSPPGSPIVDCNTIG